MNNTKLFFCMLLFCLCLTAHSQERKQAISGYMDNYRYAEAVSAIDSTMSEINAQMTALEDSLQIVPLMMQQRDLVLLKANCLKRLYRIDAAVASLTDWNEKYFLLTNKIDGKIISELAECHSLNGNYEEALSSYAFLATTNPENMYYALHQTIVSYKLEFFPETVSLGKQLLRRDSTYSAVLSLVGNSYNKMGLADSALVYYDRLLRLNPMDVSTLSKKANILFASNQPEKVVNLAGNFMQMDSTNLVINPIYGLAQHLSKQYEGSLNTFLKQQRLGDDSYGTNYYIGLNYFMLDKKFNAESYFEKAYQIDSTDVNLVYYYASSKAWRTYRFDEAKDLFDKALKMMTPDSVMMHKIYAGYALGYYLVKDYPNTIKYYKLSLEQNPQYYSSIKVIAYCYEAMKDYKTALSYYKQYLSMVPNKPLEKEWAELKIREMEGEIFMEDN